jgi:hypothetical protein
MMQDGEGGPTEPSRNNQLPAPQMGMIADIERTIKQLSRTQALKERVCEYIQQEVCTRKSTVVKLLLNDNLSLNCD